MQNRENLYEGTRPEDLCRAIKTNFGAEEEIRSLPPELQIQKLVKWSEECSFSIDLNKLEEYSDNTAEHKVWCDVENSLAIKKTFPGSYGFVPSVKDGELISKESDVIGYLDRLSLQNDIFGDEILILGILPPEPSVVLFEPDAIPILTCQPWYFACGEEIFPSEESVAEFLSEKGFVPVKNAFYGWVNIELEVYILDAKPDNFILTSEGVMPIDLQMARISNSGLS